MVDDLESRLSRVPVDAGDVRKEVETGRPGLLSAGRTLHGWLPVPRKIVISSRSNLTLSIALAFQPMKSGDGRMVLQFFDIGDRGRKGHLPSLASGRSFAPVQDALFPHVKEANQEDSDVHQHFPQAKVASDHAR